MIAYKGFEKNLSCRGYQFKRYGINETTEANCRQNGFHCAENPLDCLVHYPNWRNSRYFVVKAFGDLDEDDWDTKISCTKMELKEELDFSMLLLREQRIWQYIRTAHGAAWFAKKQVWAIMDS